MPGRETDYTYYLGLTDRLKIRFAQDGHRIMDFSVQYEALIQGHWRKITRFDSTHGQPHQHIFYFDGQDYRRPMSTPDNNKAFTEAQTIIKKGFTHMREDYIINLERGGRTV